MSIKMKPVPGNDPVTLFSAGFDPLGIGAGADRLLESRLAGESVTVMLPYQYAPGSDGHNGPAVVDPLTIFIDLPVGEYEEEKFLFSVSLAELVGEVVEWGKPVPAMSKALRDLADKIDEMRD